MSFAWDSPSGRGQMIPQKWHMPLFQGCGGELKLEKKHHSHKDNSVYTKTNNSNSTTHTIRKNTYHIICFHELIYLCSKVPVRIIFLASPIFLLIFSSVLLFSLASLRSNASPSPCASFSSFSCDHSPYGCHFQPILPRDSCHFLRTAGSILVLVIDFHISIRTGLSLSPCLGWFTFASFLRMIRITLLAPKGAFRELIPSIVVPSSTSTLLFGVSLFCVGASSMAPQWDKSTGKHCSFKLLSGDSSNCCFCEISNSGRAHIASECLQNPSRHLLVFSVPFIYLFSLSSLNPRFLHVISPVL